MISAQFKYNNNLSVKCQPMAMLPRLISNNNKKKYYLCDCCIYL